MSQSPLPTDIALLNDLSQRDVECQPDCDLAVDVGERVEEQLGRVLDLLAVEREAPSDATCDAPRQASAKPTSEKDLQNLELSIVMPCLDEADTVGTCVIKAMFALEKMGISGEVIVADNGSRDDSVKIAEELGARVVHVSAKGYGAALMGGIEAARGRFILMGDADDSYDFSQAHRFYEKLCDGADLVQGCRLPSGGGRVMPNAMPLLHQYGNPALTWLVQKMFHAPIHDVYCGMRGFTKELYDSLNQRCTGMEFATEMIIKSTLFKAKIAEVPITLHPDGRKAHRPHLRTFRDGWRTLRFFLLQSPRWTFLAPGVALAGLGLSGYALVLTRASIGGVVFEAHTLLVATLALLMATQLGTFALLAKTFAAAEGILPADARVERFVNRCTLERTLWTSAALIAVGVSVVAWQAAGWAAGGFGNLDYAQTMRWSIPAVGAIALGTQCAFSSFLMSVLRMARR
ncbi:MAG: glycosyltransferase family 2 protein [Planctomycetales bacterium]|nr:glycosyltransferase family 2 protein [Planctomycetales bacterium]